MLCWCYRALVASESRYPRCSCPSMCHCCTPGLSLVWRSPPTTPTPSNKHVSEKWVIPLPVTQHTLVKNLLLKFLKLKWYVGIIIDSHSIVRNNTERCRVHFAQLSSVIISRRTIVQCHNRRLTQMQSDTEHFHHHTVLSCPFLATSTLFLPLSLNFRQPLMFFSISVVLPLKHLYTVESYSM